MQSVHTLVCGDSTYYCAKEAAKALGYTNPQKAIRDHVFAQDRCVFGDLVEPGTSLRYQQRTSTYITTNGLKALVLKSQQPNSLQLAADLGIDVQTKFIRKEPEIVKHLQEFLGELHVATEFQKTVGRYRIDLYLPDYNLAFEVDEYGHRDRDPQQERCREEFLRRSLGCDFMRVDPDAPGFSIFKVCAQVADRVLRQHIVSK